MSAPHEDLDQYVRQELAAIDRFPRRVVDGDGVVAGDGEVAGEGRSALFDAMAGSRLVDIQARRMREQGHGFYTIGSAGHESNALVAAALRPTDPALLHYRSGAFYLARSLQAGRPLGDGLRDILLGMLALTADPASGGRHKVFGHPDLAVIPQTSTIASHLPRAMGVAFAITRAARLGLPTRWPADAVVVTSFGDASLNHSTAVGALNTIGYSAHTGLAMPIVLVCEDNGLGISVPTPEGWVAAAAQRPGIEYIAADGDDPAAVLAAAASAAATARNQRRPVLLHLRTVRYLGHAGTDVESGYRPAAQIAEARALDPLLALARTMSAPDLAGRYATIADQVRELADTLLDQPRLRTAAAIAAPLAPPPGDEIAEDSARRPGAAQRLALFDGKLPEQADGGLTLAQSINAALTDALASRPELLVFGEDVGRKGGVYGVTLGLQQRFRAARVFDTLLDEQSILGLALGLGVSGLLPVPEIQYLAYLHNAEDQLRGEAAGLRFFSAATFTNPMVVRIAGLAYQKGFGGHFHNDNSLAVLRDIPGLVVGVPARPDDAVGMLRTCLAAASTGGTVSALVEPIALYHERDLYRPGDRAWLAPYPDGAHHVPIGRARTYGHGNDLTILSFGNGVRMSLRVGARLGAAGIGARIVDLRWISPLPVEDLLSQAQATGRVLVADETRHSGGVGEGIVTALVEGGFRGPIVRASSVDSFIPLGDAAAAVLLGEEQLEDAARGLMQLGN